MIRFIDLGKQVGLDEDWPREFAFFNTVSDRFYEFGGSQKWRSWDDFTYFHCSDNIERFRRLCPDWVFAANKGRI